MKTIKIKKTLYLSDKHWPKTNMPAFRAALQWAQQNKPERIVLLGDNLDCEPVSRHNKGKPGLKETGGLRKDIDGFLSHILLPLEQAAPNAERVIFEGNHEAWVEQMLEEQPELKGCLDIPHLLDLKRRGWEWVPQGEHRMFGKVAALHGDSIGSSLHVAKKLVDTYCCTAVMGHVHKGSMYTKTSAAKKQDKWVGITLPGLCDLSPRYGKGAPNAWSLGCGIQEEWDEYFNMYVVFITNGRFVYGSKMYGTGK